MQHASSSDQPQTGPAGTPDTDFLSSLEQQLQRLKDVQKQHADQARVLSEREALMAEREVVLTELEVELSSKRKALEEARSELTAHRDALETQRVALAEMETALEAREADFEQRHSEGLDALESEREAFEEEQRALIERRRTLEAEREALDAELREAAVLQASILDDRRALDQRQAELSEQQLSLEELRAALATERMETEERARLILERERALTEERAALDEGVHEAILASAEALAERDDKIVAFEREIESLREAAGNAEDLADELAALTDERKALLRRVVVLETNLTELAVRDSTRSLQVELGAAREERARLVEQLSALEQALESAEAKANEALNGHRDQDTQVEELRSRLSEAEARLHDETIARSEAEASCAALESEVARYRLEAEQMDSEAAEKAEAELARLRDEHALAMHCREEAESEVARLRAQLETMEAAAAESASTAAAVESGPEADVREKTRRLAEIARHLKLRKLRLERYRAVIQMRRDEPREEPKPQPVAVISAEQPEARAKRREAEMEQHAAQVRHLEQQRHEIAEARRMLAIKERRMIRRWAQPRAIAVTAWLGILLCISGGISWLIVGHLYPPTVAARVDIEPRSHRVGALPESMLLDWQRAHVTLITDSAFQQQLARRMRDLKLPSWDSDAAVARTITQDLTMDLADPGRVTLVLAGRSRHEVTIFLDVLATTLAAESARQYRRLGDGVWAVAMGERREGDQLRYSTMQPIPIRDDRLRRIGPVLGGVFGFALVVILIAYSQLSRVKREFDSDGALFDEEPIAAST